MVCAIINLYLVFLERGVLMKLNTRLLITFLTIVILPLVLTVVAFCGIGFIIKQNVQEVYGLDRVDISILADPVQGYGKLTDDEFTMLERQISVDVKVVEDTFYLDSMNERIKNKSSYLIVRKNNEIYYSGNQIGTNHIFDSLPRYGRNNVDTEIGYYYNSMQKLVKQIDFIFDDGEKGSIFIVTKVNSLISVALLRDMFIAIVLILIFTSFTLTRWIRKGVFTPIRELNSAMQNIAEGNFDFALETECNGEIGDLYNNYEQMRLRLKESGEEKVQADNQNRELVSNISHDLKTPITSIRGYVEGIMDGVADTPEKMDKYIKTIYNKTKDMDRLINELTIYSKIDSNRIPYHFHKINISEYFNDCIEEVGLDLESRNIELNYYNLVSKETVIIADPEQLKRVINNIISNSVKYIDKKSGIIDIRILDEVDSIRVEIEDNGKGISARELGKIFERFYRTDESRNSAQGGSGIGLSIVKKIVEDHGGYIWATSKEEEGTCMHFVIRKYRESDDKGKKVTNI